MPKLTPKQDFQKDTKAVTFLADLCDSEGYTQAAKMALLQMLTELADTSDPVKAAAEYHRMIGAREFMSKLMTMADMPKPFETNRVPSNLNHQIK